MTLYRISSAKYSANDGEGAKLFGGRWNHKGTPVLYCAETASLCALEVLAHAAALPKGMVMIVADVPDDLPVIVLAKKDLPKGWKAAIAPEGTKILGTNRGKSKGSAILSVPSVIVPGERNYLLNPAHPDFKKITFSAPKAFVFDKRLK